jgi:hypothetical protein
MKLILGERAPAIYAARRMLRGHARGWDGRPRQELATA